MFDLGKSNGIRQDLCSQFQVIFPEPAFEWIDADDPLLLRLARLRESIRKIVACFRLFLGRNGIFEVIDQAIAVKTRCFSRARLLSAGTLRSERRTGAI